jgi:hypothetical protein
MLALYFIRTLPWAAGLNLAEISGGLSKLVAKHIGDFLLGFRVLASSYRDWIGDFSFEMEEVLKPEIGNETLSKVFWKRKKNNPYNDDPVTKKLQNILKRFNLTLNNYQELQNMKQDSNALFHRREGIKIKDAKDELNRTVFPEELSNLKCPLINVFGVQIFH